MNFLKFQVVLCPKLFFLRRLCFKEVQNQMIKNNISVLGGNKEAKNRQTDRHTHPHMHTHTHPSSSLKNRNGKIQHRILEVKFSTTLKKIIYSDQVGFIPRMLVWICICKPINITQDIVKLRDKLHNHFNRCRR